MARRKTLPACSLLKSNLAERLKQVRTQLMGERGGPEMARQLGLPVRTWYNYESGITVPAEVVLRFVELTGVDPVWLLRGEGDAYKNPAQPPPEPSPDPRPVRELLREALARLGAEADSPATSAATATCSAHAVNGRVAVTELALEPVPPRTADYRCVRVEDDQMKPIVGIGAVVAFTDHAEPLDLLDGQLVAARVEDRLIVRWLQVSGRYAILRSEVESESTLVELPDDSSEHPIRRVLWISTPH